MMVVFPLLEAALRAVRRLPGVRAADAGGLGAGGGVRRVRRHLPSAHVGRGGLRLPFTGSSRTEPRPRPPTLAAVSAEASIVPDRVAVVIPAKDEAERIAATVTAAASIPGVDLVVVVDDGSADTTQHLARDAGAVVVRHQRNRGKAAAMETGGPMPSHFGRSTRAKGRRAAAARPALRGRRPGRNRSEHGSADRAGAGGRGRHDDRPAACAVDARRWARPGGQPVAFRDPPRDRLDGDPAALGNAVPDPRGVRGSTATRPGLGRRDRDDDRPADAGLQGRRGALRPAAPGQRHRPRGPAAPGSQYRDVALALAVRRARGLRDRGGRARGLPRGRG